MTFHEVKSDDGSEAEECDEVDWHDDESEAEENDVTKDAIPVTILSGFLGAGKTTLLRHILQSQDHQLKVAVIVNDMAELNIDADLVRQVKKEVITLENGCICCTLRGDLIREIDRIQSKGSFDYVVIESTGIAEPQQVAESFCADPETAALAEEKGRMLWNVARLDTCVTVIDACDFPRYLTSLHRFKDKFNDGLESADIGEGEKNIGHLLIEQVEFANVILINKTDLVSTEELESTTQIIKTLNPKAIILPTRYGILEPSKILNTKLFSMEEAEKSPGWLVSLGTKGSEPIPTSESEEYGISSFVYRARKPFHPARLKNWIDEVFVLTSSWLNDKTIANTNDERLESMNTQYGQILRSKGFSWIAGRDSHTAGWAHSGRLISLDAMRPWYASQPESEWETEGEDDLKMIQSKFMGEHGDRRQEIVFIGLKMQKTNIVESLDACLLTDDEMLSHNYSDDGRKYFDPLPPWMYHYVEPSVLAVVIRPGQTHKFHVEDDVQVNLSNIALNLHRDWSSTREENQRVVVTVWMDFCTEGNRRTGSTLLCTLRSGQHEQHSLSLVIPGTSSEDHNGPMMLRSECLAGNSDEVEVHVSGSVIYLPAFQAHEYDDDECKDGQEHNHKRRRVTEQTVALEIE